MKMRAASKVVLGFSVLLGLAFVPGLILTAFGLSALASITTLAALAGLIPAFFTTRTITFTSVAAVALASGLAIPAAASPWLAALIVGVLGVGTGLAARDNASGPVVMAPVSVIFLIATPPQIPSDFAHPGVLVGLLAGGAALWGAVAGLVIKHLRPATPQHPAAPIPWRRVRIYAITLGVVLASAMFVVVEFNWQHGGGWFAMTFVLILQPYVQDARSKTLQRALGTIAGFAIAMVIYFILGGFPTVLYVLGFLCVVAAMTLRYAMKRPYWQFVAFLTPAVVLLEGVRTSITETALQRLGFTLLAVVLALVLESLIAPIDRRMSASESSSAPESSAPESSPA